MALLASPDVGVRRPAFLKNDKELSHPLRHRFAVEKARATARSANANSLS